MMNDEQRAAAEARNAYARAWRAANKDKVRASNQRYWMRRAERQKKVERKGEEVSKNE